MSNAINEGTSTSIFSDNYCRVPYPSSVSYDDHERIRVRIEDFLFKNNLISTQRIDELHQKHLTRDEWQMIESTPERYWPVLYAKRMTSGERALVKNNPVFQDLSNRPGYLHRFSKSFLEWFDTAEKIYAQTHSGAEPKRDEEIYLAQQLGEEHRAFFALAEGIAGLVIDDPWAEKIEREVGMREQEEIRKQNARRAEIERSENLVAA